MEAALPVWQGPVPNGSGMTGKKGEMGAVIWVLESIQRVPVAKFLHPESQPVLASARSVELKAHFLKEAACTLV